MRNIGYVIVGFNVGIAFGDWAIRHGCHAWGRAGEIQVLISALAISVILVVTHPSRTNG